MTAILDVTCVAVAVADQDEALAFFTGTIGFEVRRDIHMGETFRWVTVAARGATVEVALQHDPEHAGSDTGICFATPDAQAERQRLAGAGVSVDELLRWPGVPPMFKFSDRDGNVYTMIETA